MIRFALVTVATLAGAIAIRSTAAATTLPDLEAQGYDIIRTSTISGLFTGCVKGQALSLADGSTFACSETRRVNITNPTVLLLQLLPQQSYVLLIGGHAYAGTFLQLGSLKLGDPIGMETVSDAPPTVPTAEPEEDRIHPVDPVDSINDLRVQDRLELNTAQRYDLDIPDAIKRPAQ